MEISWASVVVKSPEMGAAWAMAAINAVVVAVVSHRKAGMLRSLLRFWALLGKQGRGENG